MDERQLSVFGLVEHCSRARSCGGTRCCNPGELDRSGVLTAAAQYQESDAGDDGDQGDDGQRIHFHVGNLLRLVGLNGHLIYRAF